MQKRGIIVMSDINMNQISILIQTYNEEKNIKDAISSAKLLTDSIVLIDMQSTDRTIEMAKENGAQIVEFGSHPQYVEPAREFGIKQVKADWVFILDADERLTEELAEEINKAIQSKTYTHYKIPRKNIFGGKTWLQHGGWLPDEQMRLIKLSAFKTWPTSIHSTPIIEGKLGHLKQPFLHLFHGNIQSMVDKTLVFEDIESDLLSKANRPVSTGIFFRKFFGELYRRLFKHQGYKDGKIGIIESIYQAFSKTITYLFLYEKKNSRTL